MPTLISALASLVVGLFLGGCAHRDDGLSESLLYRNAELEDQLATQHQIANGLVAALILTACGLAASLVVGLLCSGKGGSCDGNREQETPQG